MSLIEVESPRGIKPINSRCWLKDEGSERQIWLHYALFMRYPRDDAVSQRVAVACLARAKVAPKTEIGRAFGYHRNYVARLEGELEKHGIEAMLAGKPGPKGPRKFHVEIRRRVCHLYKQGLGFGAIARQLREEWGVRISLRSVGRIVQEGAKKDNLQACLDDACSLVLPLLSATPVTSPVKESTEAVGQAEEMPRPVVKEGREFSAAGGFLYYPALAVLGVVGVFQKVYHKLTSRRYGLRELVLALFFLWALRFSSVEAFKGAQQRDFGALIGAARSPALKTVRRKLQELAAQKQGHRLLMEMAHRYAEGDVVELGVLYADGHMKPYYGSRSIGEVWSPLRRMGMPGFHQYFVNDRAGRPLFFLTAQAQRRSLVHMLPKLVEHIRSVIGEGEFTLVFDRGGYSPELFGVLRDNKVHVITYRRRPFDLYPTEAFARRWCESKGERHEYQLYEETIRLRKLGPVRNIAVLRDDGRQTHILTTDPEREAPLVAHLMFNRWGQENFFKYMLKHFSLDALHGYGAEEIPGELVVRNPERQAVEGEIRGLRSRMKTLREELGALTTREAAEEQVEPLRQQLVSMEDQLRALVKRRRQMPVRVPLRQTELRLEALDLEKKVIIDTIKIAAYNAEEWLLERLDRYYDDHRDIRQLLRIFTRLKGRLWLRNGYVVADLVPPEIPRYRMALEGLCAELNALSVPFPGTSSQIRFALAGTEVHNNRHRSITPMS